MAFRASAAALGVDVGAAATDIAQAYRRKVVQHHPDKGGSPDAFREVTEAKDYLMSRLNIAEIARVVASEAAPLTPTATMDIFIFGDKAAHVCESDLCIGDSFLRTSSRKGTSHMNYEFEEVWKRHPSRSKGCLLVVISGGFLSDIARVLAYISSAKNFFWVLNGFKVLVVYLFIKDKLGLR